MENNKEIVFNRDDENTVVKERCGFSDSIFSKQYEHALLQIEHILNQKHDPLHDAKSSILAFCGDRGEGKTSCMETVKGILKDLNTDNETGPISKFLKDIASAKANNKSNLFRNLTGTRFEILDTIDPAFFDSDHNVIELVLGMMYKNFRHENKDNSDNNRNDRDQLFNLFNDVKLCLSQLHKKDSSAFDPIDELEWLSGGLNLRDSFQELCNKYLDYFDSSIGSKSSKYLVISIDDIDLNVNGAYEMVEQIRKYLSAENCIILVSVSIDQLITVVSNYIHKLLPSDTSSNSIEMARKYVIKLFPMEYRICMPKMYNLCDRPLCLCGTDNDDKALHFTTVKEGIVKLVFNKTRFLFYNSKGGISPLIPNNLRALRHLLGMLLSMEDFKSNQDSVANKDDFKDYFYNTWTQCLSDKFHMEAKELVSIVDNNMINKTVVSILAEYLKSNENSMVEAILNAENYSYNVSIGDVFYLIDLLERSNVNRELKLMLFFLRSFYSIKLYECYDIITEDVNELYPNPSYDNNAIDTLSSIDEAEIFKSDKWFRRANAIQKLVNGSFFTYSENDILPPSAKGKKSRDLIAYGGRINSEIDAIFKRVGDGIRKYNNQVIVDDDEFKSEFRAIEFLALTTRSGISQKNAKARRWINRKSSIPAYLVRYVNDRYFIFDVMSPFYNLLNPGYAYNKFSPKLRCDDDTFFEFAKKRSWSLLRCMINEVLKKESVDDCGEVLQNLPNEFKLDDFNRLLSNSVIRNSEVLLAMMENLKNSRANEHYSSSERTYIMAELYGGIIETEMRTYINPAKNRRYTIRFAFLKAFADLLKGDEGKLIQNILDNGIEMVTTPYVEVKEYFDDFFKDYTRAKRLGTIKQSMRELYPSEVKNISDSDWQSWFPENKAYKQAETLEIFDKVFAEIVKS